MILKAANIYSRKMENFFFSTFNTRKKLISTEYRNYLKHGNTAIQRIITIPVSFRGSKLYYTKTLDSAVVTSNYIDVMLLPFAAYKLDSNVRVSVIIEFPLLSLRFPYTHSPETLVLRPIVVSDKNTLPTVSKFLLKDARNAT